MVVLNHLKGGVLNETKSNNSIHDAFNDQSLFDL